MLVKMLQLLAQLLTLLAGLAAGWTCRRRGPIAGLLVGAILATDLWFHVYKKLLGSTDLWLQALTVLIVMLLVDWSETRSERKLLLAAGLAGLGLSVKLTFGVVLLAIGLPAVHDEIWEDDEPAPTAVARSEGSPIAGEQPNRPVVADQTPGIPAISHRNEDARATSSATQLAPPNHSMMPWRSSSTAISYRYSDEMTEEGTSE